MGVTGNMYGSWTKTVCRIVEIFFGNHLRPMRRFNGAYLFSKSKTFIFKILVDCSFFKKLFNNDDEKYIFYSKLISC